MSRAVRSDRPTRLTVADIRTGLVSAGVAFLFAWVFPSAIALTAMYSFVLRRLGIDTALGVAAMSPAERPLSSGSPPPRSVSS